MALPTEVMTMIITILINAMENAIVYYPVKYDFLLARNTIDGGVYLHAAVKDLRSVSKTSKVLIDRLIVGDLRLGTRNLNVVCGVRQPEELNWIPLPLCLSILPTTCVAQACNVRVLLIHLFDNVRERLRIEAEGWANIPNRRRALLPLCTPERLEMRNWPLGYEHENRRAMGKQMVRFRDALFHLPRAIQVLQLDMCASVGEHRLSADRIMGILSNIGTWLRKQPRTLTIVFLNCIDEVEKARFTARIPEMNRAKGWAELIRNSRKPCRQNS
ncbi:MAG: hypothetical protein M1833_005871 [Piccolia ochrophora]|nr:MAG: hypothetical protein M1833_005871 [Piccolia ochrophora]